MQFSSRRAMLLTTTALMRVDRVALAGLAISGAMVFNAGTISGSNSAIRFAGTGNTLTLAPGSVIIGTVLGTGNDTFQLGGTGAATFDISALDNTAQYRGFGTFNKIGSSVWALTGTSTFAGPVAVNGGTLAVDGDITSMSGVIVNAGALAGSGNVGIATISSGASFAPGNGTSNSSMTVGSLAMQSGAFYVANLDPSTSSKANVTGNASLGGATVVANFAAVGGYVQKQYTILNAGSITGAFDSTVVNTNLPSGFHTSLSYDAGRTQAYLDLALDIVPPSQNGANANQRNVANAITNFFNTHGGIPMAFGNLTPNGLTQVSGEVGASGQHTNFRASTQFMNVMSDPTAAGRGAVDAVGGAAGYADEAMAYAGKTKSNNPRDAFAAFTKAPPAAALAQRWSVWAAGYGGSQTTDGNAIAGTNTSSSNIYGVAVGADYRFSPDTVAGFALAGGGTNYSVVNGGTGRSDMFQAGAFVRQNFCATYLTASAAYGWQDVTTDRYVTVAGVDRLRAEFNTNSYSGRLELGHR